MWYLEPFAASGGVGSTAKHIIQPDAKYLTKQYDAAGWSTYTNFLINEIHKYTNTPNVNDPNFASNASGVAMSYKLWGSDQERKLQETLFKRGLHDRLNACVNYWQTLNQISPDKWNTMIKANFMPNLPKNDDATAQLIQLLNGTGKFSDETIRDMAEAITGVNAETEAGRIKEDMRAAKEDEDNYAQGDGGLGNIFATGEKASLPDNNNKEG
ncbi:phage portal protein [Lactiplantibacillus plantarum]|nr:phage portal protein [Lactiplantibacillus plantarum]